MRGDAQGPALAFGDEHRLDRFLVRQFPQEFLRTVLGDLVGRELEPRERERVLQRLAERGGQLRGVGPGGDGARPQAREDLAQPVAGLRPPPHGQPLGDRHARRFGREGQEISAHWSRVSKPTRKAEPRSLAPPSRAKLT